MDPRHIYRHNSLLFGVALILTTKLPKLLHFVLNDHVHPQIVQQQYA